MHKLVHACFMSYFNAMLGSQLLYKFERLQYAEVRGQVTPDSPLGDIRSRGIHSGRGCLF